MTHIKAPKTAEDEFIEIQSATGTAVQRWAVRSLTLCKLVCKHTQYENILELAIRWLSGLNLLLGRRPQRRVDVDVGLFLYCFLVCLQKDRQTTC